MTSWQQLVADHIVVCPADQGHLVIRDESWVQCETCALKFPVVDDIPVLLLTDAVAAD